MSVCKNCGREITWLYIKGKYVPVDPSPAFVIQGEGADRFYDEEQEEIVLGARGNAGRSADEGAEA